MIPVLVRTNQGLGKCSAEDQSKSER